MKFKITCRICACALGIATCSHVVLGGDIPADELNSAGLELLATCSETNRGQPILISPFSVDSAFALLWLGSSEPVQAEISCVLGFSGGVMGLARANRMLTKTQEPRILTANSLWADKRFKIADAYLELVNRHFPSSVFDFDNTKPDESANTINSYVAKNTQDMITNLLSPVNIVPGMTDLILLNTLYFKGDWLEPFRNLSTIKKYEFNSLDGQATDVEMMCDKRAVRYGETPEYQVLSLPYKGADQVYTFVAVLPTPRLDVEDLVKSLAKTNAFAEMLRACGFQKVRIKLPKLDFKFKTSLVDALRKRGMKLPFDPEPLSFAAIGNVYRVSEVIHATRIKMDEEGTEAAAATAIMMAAESCAYWGPPDPPVPEFTADHPYLAFIMDNRTGLMLFVGIVRNIGTNPHKGVNRDELERREEQRRADFRLEMLKFEKEIQEFKKRQMTKKPTPIEKTSVITRDDFL